MTFRWIVKQRSNKGALVPEPPIFPLPNTNPGHRRQESQSKYATLPAKRSNALVPVSQNKRPRYQASSSSLRPKEWELSRDRFAQHDSETLEWCDKFGIDIVSLANGTQKRPPLPSFADIQKFDVHPHAIVPANSRLFGTMQLSLKDKEFVIIPAIAANPPPSATQLRPTN